MKQYRVIFAARAERQLDNLYAYIAARSGDARADDFVSGIVADCVSLSVFPERAVKRDDIRPNLRTKSYAGRVTIAFSIDDDADEIVVLGVFYGGQNFEPSLSETGDGD